MSIPFDTIFFYVENQDGFGVGRPTGNSTVSRRNSLDNIGAITLSSQFTYQTRSKVLDRRPIRGTQGKSRLLNI